MTLSSLLLKISTYSLGMCDNFCPFHSTFLQVLYMKTGTIPKLTIWHKHFVQCMSGIRNYKGLLEINGYKEA